MSKKENFLMTSDKETKQMLIKAGYTVISENGKNTTFLNCNKLNFENLDKVIFTNKLCI